MCNREAVCRMEDKELTVLGAQAFRLLLVDHAALSIPVTRSAVQQAGTPALPAPGDFCNSR